MALVPRVTDITSRLASWSESEIIDAINDEIVANSTLLAIDDYNAAEGVTIGFTTSGEGQQVNLRKSAANTIQVGIEPSGSITDAGDSVPTLPAGTSADWSGERAWDTSLGSPSGSSKLFLVELPDAFAVVITDSTNTWQIQAGLAGRISISINSADAAAQGQDGLGYHFGAPDNVDGSGGDWIGPTSPCSTLHWATNEWSDHITWALAPSVADVASPADTTYRPLPPGVYRATDIDGTSSDQTYGPSKYIRGVNSTAVPKSLVSDGGSNQAWMHYNDTSSSENEAIIWDKTVTP